MYKILIRYAAGGLSGYTSRNGIEEVFEDREDACASAKLLLANNSGIYAYIQQHSGSKERVYVRSCKKSLTGSYIN
jgi:hypothetical protein